MADREVEGSEAMGRITNAIGSLYENYRFILSLQLEGMKPQKMAELIGFSAEPAKFSRRCWASVSLQDTGLPPEALTLKTIES